MTEDTISHVSFVKWTGAVEPVRAQAKRVTISTFIKDFPPSDVRRSKWRRDQGERQHSVAHSNPGCMRNQNQTASPAPRLYQLDEKNNDPRWSTTTRSARLWRLRASSL